MTAYLLPQPNPPDGDSDVQVSSVAGEQAAPTDESGARVFYQVFTRRRRKPSQCEKCRATDRWYVSIFKDDAETPLWFSCECGERHIKAEIVREWQYAAPDLAAFMEVVTADLADRLSAQLTRLAHDKTRRTGCGCANCRRQAASLSEWVNQRVKTK
jgi:hypothetical protein